MNEPELARPVAFVGKFMDQLAAGAHDDDPLGSAVVNDDPAVGSKGHGPD
ncbi:MAG: hypothetical protein J4G12_03395 [Gemmatimonadetes bacterium]|nr:hypothetical protein [Gemmatimonadota bacterium]